MSALLDSLVQLLIAVWNVLLSLAGVLLPWTALILFVAFWLLAVDWNRLWTVLIERGGLVGLVLIALLSVLVWGVVSPPEGGMHQILGLRVGNFTGKFFFVTALVSIIFVCGGVQLAGTVDRYLVFRRNTGE